MKRWQRWALVGLGYVALLVLLLLALMAKTSGWTTGEFFEWLAFWIGYWAAPVLILAIPGIPLFLWYMIRKREREERERPIQPLTKQPGKPDE